MFSKTKSFLCLVFIFILTIFISYSIGLIQFLDMEYSIEEILKTTSIYETCLLILSEVNIQYMYFISLFTLLALSFNLIIRYFLSLKNKENLPFSSFAFVFLFFLFLCIPMLKINKGDISQNENRALAVYRPFFTERKINSSFGEDFEKYFNDRFFLRKNFIKWNNSYNKRMQNSTIAQTSRVIFGKENWLFYTGNNSIQNYQNKQLFLLSELKFMAQYLVDIDTWCKKEGKEFHFIIAPDKNKIYGEFFPKKYNKYKEDIASRTIQLVQYLKENTEVSVLYCYDILHANKVNGLLYFKNDTHWNEFGAYIAYSHLIQMIDPELSIPHFTASEFTEKIRLRGDLTNMLFDSPDDTHSIYKTPVFHSVSQQKNIADGVIEFSNSEGKKSLFLQRDSFSSALLPYLSYSFQNIHARHWNLGLQEKDLDYIKENSDIFILQMIERRIPQLMSQLFPQGEQK